MTRWQRKREAWTKNTDFINLMYNLGTYNMSLCGHHKKRFGKTCHYICNVTVSCSMLCEHLKCLHYIIVWSSKGGKKKHCGWTFHYICNVIGGEDMSAGQRNCQENKRVALSHVHITFHNIELHYNIIIH